MYLCGPRKHSCQPFCGPEGRFYCSDSVCSLWPVPFSYLRMSVRILCVLKIVCGWESKTWWLPYACCGLHFIDSAACPVLWPLRTITYIYICIYIYMCVCVYIYIMPIHSERDFCIFSVVGSHVMCTIVKIQIYVYTWCQTKIVLSLVKDWQLWN